MREDGTIHRLDHQTSVPNQASRHIHMFAKTCYKYLGQERSPQLLIIHLWVTASTSPAGFDLRRSESGLILVCDDFIFSFDSNCQVNLSNFVTIQGGHGHVPYTSTSTGLCFVLFSVFLFR